MNIMAPPRDWSNTLCVRSDTDARFEGRPDCVPYITYLFYADFWDKHIAPLGYGARDCLGPNFENFEGSEHTEESLMAWCIGRLTETAEEWAADEELSTNNAVWITEMREGAEALGKAA